MQAQVNDYSTFRTVSATFPGSHSLRGTYTSVIHHSDPMLGDDADIATDGYRRLRPRNGDEPALVLVTDRFLPLSMKGVSFLFDVMQGCIAQYNQSLYAAVAAFNASEPFRAWVDFSPRNEIVIFISKE